ncbi:kelch repeat-containing protein [Promethearchaeum syntrophicum]|uniref:Kelch repeat-containing protein n=1 Tax=Promethearchaeum syntrophicum TaxID=2594042 RepID=A0A5B9DC46_9ARCH|nr:kelch repeat-containing protein [Candidatus Prometheoarchaeum syntrophicum]QEE16744.1 Kelch motif protein [Candidatus Prometheoarchaeum syntrophicum]
MRINQKSIIYLIILLYLSCIPSLFLTNYCNAENSNDLDFPLRRYGHRMVYLPEDESIFLFGGEFEYENNLNLNNTWKYDYVSNSWRIISTTSSPISRFNHGMVYDSKNQQIILFGGADIQNYNRLGDTWIFDLNENQWSQLNIPNSPPIRSDMSYYYDEVLEALIIFGGYSQYDTRLDDTWCFYTRNNTWVEINSTNFPAARYGHQMIYDPVNNVGLMYGGNDFVKYDDTWQFNSSNFEWTELHPSNIPMARYWHNMVYNENIEQVIIFGGRNDANREYLTNVWNFDVHLKEWEEVQNNNNPFRREMSSMVYHNQSNVIVLFGGIEGFDSQSLSDLWVYDLTNQSWKELNSSIWNNWIFWVILLTGLMGILGSISYIIIRKKKN